MWLRIIDCRRACHIILYTSAHTLRHLGYTSDQAGANHHSTADTPDFCGGPRYEGPGAQHTIAGLRGRGGCTDPVVSILRSQFTERSTDPYTRDRRQAPYGA